MNEQFVKEENLKPPTKPVMEMEHIEIKAEHQDNLLLEHQSWDEVQVKQEPKVEITVEDNMVQLPEEMAHFSLIDLMAAPQEVITADTERGLSEGLHNTASLDTGMQLSLNGKPSSLSDCEIPSLQQYSHDTFKKRMCKKGNTSTMESTGIQISPHETDEKYTPPSQNEISSTTEKTLRYAKPYTCDTCHKVFSALSSLKTHNMLHTGIKPYICDSCLKCFTTLSDLKRHIRIHTSSKPYACDTCQRHFSDLSNLKTHMRMHTGNKPYICDTCLKCFTTLFDLKRHIRIHTGSKPYACDTCHRRFSDLSNLRTHTRIHTGSKPYTCNTCHKCFSDLSNLKSHKRLHTGSKPYTCDTCLKSFNSKFDLKRHNRIHTGSKPYSCDSCHRSFSQLGNLKTHKNTHKDKSLHL